ncbi:hypothetical protein GJ688_04230 [Heliobacillus mobilis]|uniref:Germination protein, Ger(X)C family n=1 Tax=Heliobacterium mobile TaxID=28064 RepID=A0A6I3SH71_HELMO|nr:Ger(x)C family spore germination C-terminal domain-containing protein [Heliobacterium mobile]MTV48191.1 hypothetical protein [Heliobacterium mobile]
MLFSKKFTFLNWLLILSILTNGCYDRREVEDMSYPVAIGLDKGVTDDLRFSVQVENVGGTQGGGGMGQSGQGQATKNFVFTVDAPNPYAGMNMINTFLSKQLNFQHIKMIAVSEDLAKSGELEKYLPGMTRIAQIREIPNLVITKGKVDDFLKENTIVVGSEIIKATYMVINLEGKNTELFPIVKFFDFYTATKSNMEQPIATLANTNFYRNLVESGVDNKKSNTNGQPYVAGELPRSGGQKREFFGTAVFRGGKMVGELNGDETRLLQMIRGDFTRSFMTFKDPLQKNFVLSIDVRTARKPEITVDVQQETPEIHVVVSLEGDLIGVQSRINYEELELKSILEQAIARDIKQQMDELIKNASKTTNRISFDSAIKPYLTSSLSRSGSNTNGL